MQKAFCIEKPEFAGLIDVDDSYYDSIEGNKRASKKTHHGIGFCGMVAVIAMKDHDAGQVHAEVPESTSGNSLQGFVHKHTDSGVTVHTDDHKV